MRDAHATTLLSHDLGLPVWRSVLWCWGGGIVVYLLRIVLLQAGWNRADPTHWTAVGCARHHGVAPFGAQRGKRHAMKRSIRVLAVCAALCATASWAKPAAWYLWRSPSADNFVCAQVSPGDDWVVMKGPFKDSLCRKPGEPS